MEAAGLIWGLLAVITVMAILSASIIAGVLVHSRKIRESENKFRLLFNRVHDALIVFRPDESIISVNESACLMMGYEGKEFLNLSLKDIVQKDKWLAVHEGIARIFESEEEYRGESVLINNEGESIDVELIGVNLNLNGKPLALTSIRDIMKRKKTEAELKKSNYALTEVLAHLEDEKMKIKQQVAETVDQVLMPALNRLPGENNNKIVEKSPYYDVLKSGLEELSNASGGILHAYSKLTPREIEICNLIKNGVSSKEIANSLSISMLTVNKHRERIRKKLVISNKNVNLTSYLKRL